MAHAAGGCYVCQRGDSLVNTDAQIVGEGILALCKGCIQDLAEAADLTLNGAAVTELRLQHAEERKANDPEAVAALQAQLEETEAALAAAENTIASFQDAFERIGKQVAVEEPALS